MSHTHHHPLGPMSNCSSDTPACPISKTTYGYVPNEAANAMLAAVFGICTLAQLCFGIYFRTWAFAIPVLIACAMELFGYVGRLLLVQNVWDQTAFLMQITCLTLAPTFLAAGLYLSLKRIIQAKGPQHSRLRPALYTWVFIGADIVSIVVQALGGGIAAGLAGHNDQIRDIGNNLIIGGIAFQVATMCICGALAADFTWRYWKRGHVKTPSGAKFGSNEKLKLYSGAIAFVFITVLIRCCYPIYEMAGGWGGPLMREEVEFLALDGMMIAMAASTFAIFHPGFWCNRVTVNRMVQQECHTPEVYARNVIRRSEELGHIQD